MFRKYNYIHIINILFTFGICVSIFGICVSIFAICVRIWMNENANIDLYNKHERNVLHFLFAELVYNFVFFFCMLYSSSPIMEQLILLINNKIYFTKVITYLKTHVFSLHITMSYQRQRHNRGQLNEQQNRISLQ